MALGIRWSKENTPDSYKGMVLEGSPMFVRAKEEDTSKPDSTKPDSSKPADKKREYLYLNAGYVDDKVTKPEDKDKYRADMDNHIRVQAAKRVFGDPFGIPVMTIVRIGKVLSLYEFWPCNSREGEGKGKDSSYDLTSRVTDFFKDIALIALSPILLIAKEIVSLVGILFPDLVRSALPWLDEVAYGSGSDVKEWAENMKPYDDAQAKALALKLMERVKTEQAQEAKKNEETKGKDGKDTKETQGKDGKENKPPETKGKLENKGTTGQSGTTTPPKEAVKNDGKDTTGKPETTPPPKEAVKKDDGKGSDQTQVVKKEDSKSAKKPVTTTPVIQPTGTNSNSSSAAVSTTTSTTDAMTSTPATTSVPSTSEKDNKAKVEEVEVEEVEVEEADEEEADEENDDMIGVVNLESVATVSNPEKNDDGTNVTKAVTAAAKKK